MRITPSRLSVLLAVHRAGGIVAAAQAQHLTPSAVSRQIKLLEREAGVRVLDREPTGAVLTDAGRVLAEAAERIEAELASAQRELAGLDESVPAGHVRIGSFSTAIRALLLPLLAVVERTMPGVVMTIEETEERSGLARLRRGCVFSFEWMCEDELHVDGSTLVEDGLRRIDHLKMSERRNREDKDQCESEQHIFFHYRTSSWSWVYEAFRRGYFMFELLIVTECPGPPSKVTVNSPLGFLNVSSPFLSSLPVKMTFPLGSWTLIVVPAAEEPSE